MSESTFSQFATDFFARLKAQCLPRIDKVTVPFYGVQDDQVKRDRTGVLYRVGGHHFILTASHYLRPIVENGIPLYVDRADFKSLPIPLAAAKFHTTEEEGRDVAAVKLPEGVVEKLLETKEFLTHADVRLTDDAEDSLYLMFGFPEDWSGVANESSLAAHPLIFASCRYHGERHPDAFFDPKVHIVLQFDQSAVTVPDNSKEQLPRLHGVSGCGIWKVANWSRESLERWHPDQVSLVAIQHRWFPQSKYIQGTWVGYVLALIQENYPEVSTAMNLIYPKG